MLVFEGADLDSCVFWVERYFSVNRLTEEEKVEAATMCLDGEALA